MNAKVETKPHFTDYLYVLLKWKKLIIINLIIVIVIFTIIAFMIPEKFKATATVMIPQDNSSLGGLSSLMGNNSLVSFGAKLFGVSNTSEDILVGLLKSRTSLSSAVERFDLKRYYEISDNNMDKTLKAFSSDVIFEPNENGFLEISVINKDPNLAARISNYFVELVDSLNINLNIEQAKNNREFIGKRYSKNMEDLKAAEDSLYHIQKKYGIFAVPEQLEVSVKAAAEIEAEYLQKKFNLELVETQYGNKSPQYSLLKEQVDALSQKVSELKNSKNLSSDSNVLFPFSNIPQITLLYYRAYREVELQSKIMEFILPMFEQAKVEEQKSVPTILVIDSAVPPELKYSPKKSMIIVAAMVFSLFLMIPFIFRAENIYVRHLVDNPFEENEYKFYSGIISLYRIKRLKKSE